MRRLQLLWRILIDLIKSIFSDEIKEEKEEYSECFEYYIDEISFLEEVAQDPFWEDDYWNDDVALMSLRSIALETLHKTERIDWAIEDIMTITKADIESAAFFVNAVIFTTCDDNFVNLKKKPLL